MHSFQDIAVLVMKEFFRFLEISLDVSGIFQVWKRHMKALKKRFRMTKQILEKFENSTLKIPKNWIFGVFFMFFSFFQRDEKMYLNFGWNYQKDRSKCFKNHYNFCFLCLFFTKICMIMCKNFQVSGSLQPREQEMNPCIVDIANANV